MRRIISDQVRGYRLAARIGPCHGPDIGSNPITRSIAEVVQLEEPGTRKAQTADRNRPSAPCRDSSTFEQTACTRPISVKF
jgi:hypothetical protein